MSPQQQWAKTERRPQESTGISTPLTFPLPTPALPASISPSAEGPITYAAVVKAVQDAMVPLIAAQTEQLQQAVQAIQSQVAQLISQVLTTEHRLGETFHDIATLKADFKTSHLQLSNKVDDHENRSRRCNLRIVGVPESIKGHEVFKFLPDLLQIQDACSDMVIKSDP